MRRSSRARGSARRTAVGALAVVRRGAGDGARVPLVLAVLLGTALGILAGGGLGRPAQSGFALLLVLTAALLVRSSLRLRSALAAATDPRHAVDQPTRELRGREARAGQSQSQEAAASQAQKMEIVGQLAAGITHEIDNLMTVVTINAELLSDRVGPQECDPLARIVGAADQAASLSRRLLASFISARTGEGDGGLGHSIDRSVAIRSGGGVRVSSEPEQGVCFEALLPAAESARKPVPGKRALDPAPAEPRSTG